MGRTYVRRLSVLGASVVAFDDLSGTGGTWTEPRRLSSGVGTIEASILDTDALSDAAAGCSLVFPPRGSGQRARQCRSAAHVYQQVNIEGTLNVLDAARAAGARRVVFAASSAAYGDTPGLPKTETMPTLAGSPYAATKIAGEALMQAYANAEGPDTVKPAVLQHLRPAAERQLRLRRRHRRIRERRCSRGSARLSSVMEQQTRDFTHVENVVHANLLAARSLETAQRPSMQYRQRPERDGQPARRGDSIPC